jgi:hypothetical protein
MEYLINNGYKQVPDPYDNGRIVFDLFISPHSIIDRNLMHYLLNDKNFEFISNNLIYFSK